MPQRKMGMFHRNYFDTEYIFTNGKNLLKGVSKTSVINRCDTSWLQALLGHHINTCALT